MQAEAFLLVEKSILQKRKKKAAGNKGHTADTPRDHQDDDDPEEIDEEPDADEEEAEVDDDGSAESFRKTIDPSMRQYIITKECRRDEADDYFDNPPGRKGKFMQNLMHNEALTSPAEPTGICCDVCEGDVDLEANNASDSECNTVEENDAQANPESRPTTPTDENPAKPAVTPSRTRNANGKQPMQPRGPRKPQVRSREWLVRAKLALVEWRFKMKREQYRRSTYTAEVYLPDEILQRIARNATISDINDISTIKPLWALADLHAGDVLEVLVSSMRRVESAGSRKIRARGGRRTTRRKQTRPQMRPRNARQAGQMR